MKPHVWVVFPAVKLSVKTRPGLFINIFLAWNIPTRNKWYIAIEEKYKFLGKSRRQLEDIARS